ncbi:transposase, partial [Terribacillus saccharophilus]|uniref:tyrosine-type recombinase/integrase n=1 Tax=Terribacillus saccharophilus TaxID=361277 RepID=UPI000BCAE576
MRVQKISVDKRNTYLLLDVNGAPVQAVAKYMKHLYNKNVSSNTMLTYCTALKHFFTYLEQEQLSFYQVNFEVLTNFVAWLRNPYQSNKIIPHKETKARRKEKTVNVYLSAVTNFYDYLYRTDLIESDIIEKLMKVMFSGAGGNGYKSFLHHVNKGNSLSKNILKLREPKEKVKVFTKDEVETIYHTATNIRDKFMIRLFFETGLRVG